MTRQIPYRQAILEATDQKMREDPSIYLTGLGVPDPKGIFGTTLGLADKYGSERVFDMPTSENAMTGVAIGSALVGMRPLMTHQRVDFFLLALDQLINNASKWRYMFGGLFRVPLVIRLIIGRGWGQGPQHSQTLHSLFAHIPGIQVVMPSNAYDAKGLLVASLEGEDPVIFMEHRWLHNILGDVPEELYRVPIGKAKRVREGNDVTIIASSHMVVEAFQAAKLLEKEHISVDLIDLRSIRPLDHEMILSSVQKTGRLVVADPDWKTVGLSAEIIALVSEKAHFALKAPPRRITHPDRHCPTSWALSNHFYPTSTEMVLEVLDLMQKPVSNPQVMESILMSQKYIPKDVPDPQFTGPF